jgi:hypothetical protein
MIYPEDAREWLGRIAMIDWSFDTGQGRAFTHVGGRILRVDETYLYLQTLGPSPKLPRPRDNTLVTRLGLQLDWQKIALFDIDRIYEGPLTNIPIDK